MESIAKVVAFELKNVHYGIDIQHVISIEKVQRITEIPNTSKFVKGVIKLRGEVTPLVDLRERLHLGETDYSDHTKIIVVNLHNRQVGLIVDSADDVMDIDSSIIDKNNKWFGGIDKEYIKGIAKLDDHLLILLDIEQLLHSEEISEVIEEGSEK
ncbi:chemotaxis protein CheW [Oceanobacillus halotolerans]|uniref:chemotaxis protein CheW n=1 Tax=Oceanobacillus halotolerans TaxID=2663380 RepID=UPI0013DC9674|nr:chemotaxis protein CheW [Oceanobacillus halotolerans]